MTDTIGRLKELHDYYARHPMPADFTETVRRKFGVDLSARYGSLVLKNPFLVAPGQMTTTVAQVERIKNAGYGGCVLKSVVGEAPDGTCSMAFQRKKPTYVKTVYDPEDAGGSFPIIHWDGGTDLRSLARYLPFAREAWPHGDGGFPIVASILCHLPSADESFRETEWVHTTKALFDLGYRLFEIDFCPFLATQEQLMVQKTVLRWYATVPGLMKSVAPGITVYPKMLSLDFGLAFQTEIAQASREGKADGIIVANRIFRKDFGCAHGGRALRERNLAIIREIRKQMPEFPVSATGGVYSGRHAFDYLAAGAGHVQLLSHIMGNVKTPFAMTGGNKFEQVLHKLLLDPDDGFLACLLQQSSPC